MLATVTEATNAYAACLLILAVALLFIGALLLAQGVHAVWHGERLLRPRSRSIASVRSGHVVLSGVVEPAWAVLSSPFSRTTPEWRIAAGPSWQLGDDEAAEPVLSVDPEDAADPAWLNDPEEAAESADRAYVYYKAKTIRPGYRSSRTVFRETNAVPFILNDGTGRVLVLGRRARWDAATSPLDLNGAVKAVAEGDATAQGIARLYERELLAAPGPTSQRGDPGESGSSTEATIAVGERVTVIGRAAADDRALRPLDACPDNGSSFGLPGLFRIGPESLWGLNVLAGSPRDVSVRGRLRLVVGLLGVLVLVAAGVSGVLASASQVLPPEGTIVFGTSFDSWSGIHGQAATLSPDQPIAAVAKFSGQVNNGDQVTILVDGHVVASWTAEGGKSGPAACEFDFGPEDLSTGRHQVDVLGPNGAQLASGSVSVGN